MRPPADCWLKAGISGTGIWLIRESTGGQRTTTLYSLVHVSQTPPVRSGIRSCKASGMAAAFGLLQRKITEQVAMRYPDARWVWSMSNAFDQFAAGQPLTILLNGAGGYQRATVWVQNLQFAGLVYTTISAANPEQPAEEAPEQEEAPAEAKEVDYGLLSFEWAEANMQHLNALSNETVAAGQDGFRIPAEELPHGDSWPTLCAELVRNGFAAAEPMADGIHVKIKTTE